MVVQRLESTARVRHSLQSFQARSLFSCVKFARESLQTQRVFSVDHVLITASSLCSIKMDPEKRYRYITLAVLGVSAIILIAGAVMLGIGISKLNESESFVILFHLLLHNSYGYISGNDKTCATNAPITTPMTSSTGGESTSSTQTQTTPTQPMTQCFTVTGPSSTDITATTSFNDYRKLPPCIQPPIATIG